MDSKKDLKNINRKVTHWLLLPYISLKKIYYRRYYGRKILEIVKRQPLLDKAFNTLANNIFIAATFRSGSPDRQNILSVSAAVSFKDLAGSNLKISVADASPREFIKKNEDIFSKIAGLNVDYGISELKLPSALAHILENAREPYFLNFFDDQPIVGLTPEFLKASCQLLGDFNGLVDMVYICDAPKEKIDHAGKKITYDMNDLDFRSRGVEPLGIVKYGDYQFAIIPSPYIGFFFNTFIAPTKDYQNRLKWFMGHISKDSPAQIELAGSEFRGPIYYFLAVPLSVFQINIDYSHTETSVRRDSASVPKQVCAALQNNYQMVIKS